MRRLCCVWLLLAACIDPELVPCGELACAGNAICVPGPRCVQASQLSACAGKDEGADCIVSGVAGKCLDAERRPRGKAMLAKILSASFRQWVRPGDEVRLEASIVANDERFATAECLAQVGGRTAAQAKLFVTFLPKGNLAGDFRDEVLENFLAGALP